MRRVGTLSETGDRPPQAALVPVRLPPGADTVADADLEHWLNTLTGDLRRIMSSPR
ncbi:hypothetical protein ABZ070_32335 [Streptomyces sp. NPDC006283]|uniref:hypothetical protein n=1 Tax=Streptomyces sp. NPDC006283 TaxID=3156741 RepID=UPI0033B4B675